LFVTTATSVNRQADKILATPTDLSPTQRTGLVHPLACLCTRTEVIVEAILMEAVLAFRQEHDIFVSYDVEADAAPSEARRIFL